MERLWQLYLSGVADVPMREFSGMMERRERREEEMAKNQAVERRALPKSAGRA